MKFIFIRSTFITIFVILWTLAFHYESTRAFYLNPLFGRQLPKVKFLFPPAGWIMFFNVDDTYGCAEVYGFKDGQPQFIDPHLILQTRPIGYDNIHRNALSVALDQGLQDSFCRFLKRKFSYFDGFVVTVVYYPSVTKTPSLRYQRVMYRCP